jgi:NAD(P)-dependent dehydrogenase (short-subunit alcohol dehydrogenase family)
MTIKRNVAVVGATGAIGKAFIDYYSKDESVENVFAFSRKKINFENRKIKSFNLDIENQTSIEESAQNIKDYSIDTIIVATGILHSENFGPEKSIREINYSTMAKVMAVNTIGPALIGRYFIPLLRKDIKTVLAFLSARVGSISDNKLGGWYSYRASKTALNQVVKNFSIELKRTNPKAVVLALQPGTVDSNLSEPFKKNVAKGKLFSPEQSRELLSDIIAKATIKDSGNLIAYDGEIISP